MSTPVEKSGKWWVNRDEGCLHYVNGEHDTKVEVTDTGGNGAQVTLTCLNCGASEAKCFNWDDLVKL